MNLEMFVAFLDLVLYMTIINAIGLNLTMAQKLLQMKIIYGRLKSAVKECQTVGSGKLKHYQLKTLILKSM